MSKIVWDKSGEHIYETGVNHGVLYPQVGTAYPAGVPWNGLSAVTESPSGAEATPIYADNIKYLSLTSAEEFGATVEAYTFPDEFMACDGSASLVPGVFIGQQTRTPFGMAYETIVGNETMGDAFGRKIHLIYGAKATPSERNYQTVNDSPEAITFSWELNTTPVSVSGHKPTANMTIDTTKLEPAALPKLAILEAVLFGADDYSTTATYAVNDTVMHSEKLYVCKTAVTTPTTFTESSWTEVSGFTAGPRLPLPDEISEIFA